MVWRAVWAKMRWSPGLLALLAVSIFWTVSIFLAPMTIPPGSFAYTVGRANAVDHWDMYARPEFNWYAKVIYVLGDAECHQLWYRSLWINGNQMPVDARDTSLYLFANFALFWAMMTPACVSVGRGIARAFPPRIWRWSQRIGETGFAALVVVLGLLPVAVDGTVQLVTAYESTNATRVVTGIPGGLVAGLFVGTLVKSIRFVGLEVRTFREEPGPRKSA